MHIPMGAPARDEPPRRGQWNYITFIHSFGIYPAIQRRGDEAEERRGNSNAAEITEREREREPRAASAIRGRQGKENEREPRNL